MIHRLRPADSDDFAWLWRLHGECHRALRERVLGHWDEATQRAAFTELFAAATHEVAVVEVDDEPVGALVVAWEETPSRVVLLDLLPAWRGRGLGTRLLHDVMVEARQRDRALEVCLLRGSPAQSLLRRLGFKPSASPEAGGGDTPNMEERMQWAASVRTDVTLRAAMSPWADPRRRRAWVQRLFAPAGEEQHEFIRFAVGRCGLLDAGQPIRVLDAAAGSGARLRGLAALGWHVHASTADDDYREAAQRIAADLGARVSIDASPLGADAPTNSADVALSMDGALWTVLEHDARVAALTGLRAAVRPGGLLIVEGPNGLARLHAATEPPVRTEVYHHARVSRIPRQHYDFHAGVLEHRDMFAVEVAGEEVAAWTEPRSVALMGLPLLRVALLQAGWEQIETFRTLRSTGPTTATGPQLVLLARAPMASPP